ncbi:TetR/AcrR family transcriptional regulator [Furfurilactobacillus sp. WILCCON 0119]
MGRNKSFDEEETLQEMLTVFNQNGYHQASMAQLEQATGLKKNSLYFAFGDKYAMFTRVFQVYLDGIFASLTTVQTRGRQKNALEQLALLLMNDFTPANLPTANFYINALIAFKEDNGQVHDLLSDAHERYTRILTETLAVGQARGEVTTMLTVAELVDYCFNVRTGLLATVNVTPDVEDLKTTLMISLRLLEPHK